MPQDMSRAFLITLERLAFITVLVISRMIDSIRLDSTDSRIGSKLSALGDRAPTGLALTLVAKLMGRGSSASFGRIWKSARFCDHGCRPSAPVRFPSIASAAMRWNAMHRDRSLSIIGKL